MASQSIQTCLCQDYTLTPETLLPHPQTHSTEAGLLSRRIEAHVTDLQATDFHTSSHLNSCVDLLTRMMYDIGAVKTH